MRAPNPESRFFLPHWSPVTAPLECESAVSKKGSSRAEPREAWRSTLSFLAPCPFFLFTQALKLSDTHLLFTGHGVCHCEQQTPTSSGVIDGKNIVNPSLRGAPATKQSHENDCTRIEALFRTFFHFPHFFPFLHFLHCRFAARPDRPDRRDRRNSNCVPFQLDFKPAASRCCSLPWH